MTSVKDTVKETLVGSSEDPQLSHQARFNFIRHARKDENGEQFMTEDDFVNAIAPKHEDYVSFALPSLIAPIPDAGANVLLTCPLFDPAQNQARAVWHPLPSGRPTENRQT